MSRAEAVRLIAAGDRFLCSCHVRPDADALGSALGLAAILRSVGKDAVVYSEGGTPSSLTFLEGSSAVLAEIPEGPFDAVLVTDTAAKELLPSALGSVRAPLVVIDHHAVNDLAGDVEVREADAVATAEVVVRLMRDLGVASVPAAAAQPLYAALVADTGGFRYAGTTAKTLRLGADLLDQGVEPWPVASALFERWPRERMQLLAAVLGRLEIVASGAVAMVCMDRGSVEATGAADDMLEGMVNYGRMMEGVEAAALLWEPRDRECVKVSLRSAGRADVGRVAASLGGGGHRSAAGASLPPGMMEARARVEAAIARELAGIA